MPDDVDLPLEPARGREFSLVGAVVALFYAGFLIWFGLVAAGLWHEDTPERPAAVPLQLAPETELAAKASPSASPELTASESPAALVWLNTETSVYHFPGSRWYGHTSFGKYLTEADAIRKGGQPARNKQNPDSF